MSQLPAFYQRHARAVQAHCAGTGIFPSVVLAQLGLESGMGQSVLAAKYNNYGGHKAGSSWRGQTVRLKTPNDAQKVSTFRVYPSFEAFLAVHLAILTGGLYPAATAARSAEAQVAALAAGPHRYAEDAGYVRKVVACIRQYQLTQFDPSGGAGLLALVVAAAAGAAAYHYRSELADSLKMLIE